MVAVAHAPPSLHTSGVPDGWITVTEAAKRRDVPDYIIRNAINGGTLPAEKVGDIWLIRITDLDAWEWRKPGRPKAKRRGRPPKQ